MTKRKDKTIRDVPLTFWATVRGTARHKAEVFLFTTPAYPGARTELALQRLLQSIKDGNVHAGKEPIPKQAFPCFQLFRGVLIRFYTTLDGYEGFYAPVIYWKDGTLELTLRSIPKEATIIADEKAEQLWVLAEISPVLDGNYFRKFQQSVSAIAREENRD